VDGQRAGQLDKTLPAKAPAWGSEWFRDKGVVLRSRLATEEEMFLYLIGGVGALPHNHYDRDQGGITMWLRGVPVADDFGYYSCAPEEDNSMLTSAGVANKVMELTYPTVTPEYDYIRGKKAGWTREIVLVKHGDTEAPDYFVLRDTLAEPALATWRLWMVSTDDGKVELTPTGAVADSHNNCTTRLYFVQKPADATLATEEKTRSGAGMDSTGQYRGAWANTKTGVIVSAPAFDSLLTVAFTLKEGEAEPAIVLDDDGALTIEHSGVRSTIRFTDDGVTVSR
jgi:hypothetical protein